MKRITCFLLASMIISTLTACGPAPAAPSATATDRPTATATYTPSPTMTNTPVPPLVLSDFDAQMEGVGEHGNMTCITYPGSQSDLEGLTIKADISQGDKVLDANAPLESIDGKTCFEMMDAKYIPGGDVNVKLNLSKSGITLSNKSQNINLGKFDWKPFINPFFSSGNFTNGSLGVVLTHGYELGRDNEYYAIDFCKSIVCKGNVNVGEGTPVYMPFSFQVVAVRYTHWNNPDNIYPDNYNIWLYHPYTGFIFELNHQRPGKVILDYLDSIGFEGLPTLDHQYGGVYPYTQPIIPYDPNGIVSTWGPIDHENGSPHLHIEGQISYPTIGLRNKDLFPETGWIDGDPVADWGNPRYGNCYSQGQEWGPCFDSNGKPVVANISVDHL